MHLHVSHHPVHVESPKQTFQLKTDRLSSLTVLAPITYVQAPHFATDLREWKSPLGMSSSFSTRPQKPKFYLKLQCIAVARRCFSMASAECEYIGKILVSAAN